MAIGLALCVLALTLPALAGADVVGNPCNNWMKVDTDSATGRLMVCAHSMPGNPDSPMAWLPFDDHFRSLPMVGPTASGCSVPDYTMARSMDGYIVWCRAGNWSIYSP